MAAFIARIGLPGLLFGLVLSALISGGVYWWQAVKLNHLDGELNRARDALSISLGANDRLNQKADLLALEVTIQALTHHQLQLDLAEQSTEFDEIRQALNQVPQPTVKHLTPASKNQSAQPTLAAGKCAGPKTKAALSLLADRRHSKETES
jgi:hypothetical protein